jgi:hypothetical protein
VLLVLVRRDRGTALFIHGGFRATTEPSNFETGIARAVRDFAILTTLADRKILSKQRSKTWTKEAISTWSIAQIATVAMAAV